MPPGNELAWRTINRAAILIGEGFGLVSKPSGNNYNGYSVDVLMRKDGRAVDCLRDGEGAAVPTWSEIEPIDPARWRAPVPDAGGPQPPEPPQPPPPQAGYDDTQIRQELAALRAALLVAQSDLRRLTGEVDGMERATADRFARLRVTGSTGRTWSHAHEINLAGEG